MYPIEVIFPLFLSILGSLLVLLFLRLILRNSLKASLLTSLIVLLFFTYGHVFRLIKDLPGIGPLIAHQRYALGLWFFILCVGGFLVIKFGKKGYGFNLFLNRMTLILLVFVLGQLLYEQYFQTSVRINHDLSGLQDKTTFDPARVQNKNNLPDIYLIVLDSYARDDILLREFGFNNQPFLQQLTDLGFVIPKCTMTNYAWTALSMSSELNMNYLGTFYPDLDPKSAGLDYAVFTDYIRHSLVRKNLTDLGYSTISFEADAHWVEIPDATIFHTSRTPDQLAYRFLDTTEYTQLLSDSTILYILNDSEAVIPGLKKLRSDIEDLVANLNTSLKTSIQDPNRTKYNLLMSDLDYLDTMPTVPGPKFVYLHLPSPHPPQVLGPNGEFQPGVRIPGYSYAITYLNKRVLTTIKNIIAQSKTPPVIILQGDHGFSDFEDSRMYNLNAYYLPGGGSKLVYPSITPVNTFRIIFNQYFNGKYPILKDTSNWSETGFFNFKVTKPTCTH
jgi:hypothetical protein